MVAALTSALPLPASGADAAKETVVAFHNEQDLARALEPWQKLLARQQQWVKTRLVLTDLFVVWACLVVGRLPVLMKGDTSFAQALNLWWVSQGQFRLTLFLAMTALMVGWMGSVKGHYSAARRKPWWDETREVLQVVVAVAMLDALLIYFGKWELSRLWTGASWALILVALPISRLLVRQRMLKTGLLAQPYVLIGRPDDVEQAAAALASEPLMGYVPVAVVCPEPGTRLVHLGPHTAAPLTLSPGIQSFLARPASYQIVAVLSSEDNHWLRELTQELMLTRDDLIIVPALNGLPMYGMEVSHFFSHEVLLLRARNNLNRRLPQAIKRGLDIVGALTAGLLLSPLLLWVAYQIWRCDKGPVLFTQKRIGVNGEPFEFIKFRSMVLDADAALERWKTENPALYVQYLASNFKLAQDPRITPVGRWIRRTSVDELPQLINVLRGDMSLVGPRPLLARELPDYGQAIAAYGKARPGITGLWQVSGRSASTFKHRIAMDLWYVRNWSLWHDIVILFRTVRVVLRQEGAS